MRKIRSTIKKVKGETIIIEENDTRKKYLVIKSRKLIPWLGEPSGYFLTLKEIEKCN